MRQTCLAGAGQPPLPPPPRPLPAPLCLAAPSGPEVGLLLGAGVDVTPRASGPPIDVPLCQALPSSAALVGVITLNWGLSPGAPGAACAPARPLPAAPGRAWSWRQALCGWPWSLWATWSQPRVHGAQQRPGPLGAGATRAHTRHHVCTQHTHTQHGRTRSHPRPVHPRTCCPHPHLHRHCTSAHMFTHTLPLALWLRPCSLHLPGPQAGPG